MKNYRIAARKITRMVPAEQWMGVDECLYCVKELVLARWNDELEPLKALDTALLQIKQELPEESVELIPTRVLLSLLNDKK